MKTIDEHILIKYVDGLSSEEEKGQVESWLAESSENQNVLDQLFFTIQVANRLKVMKSVNPDEALLRFKERVHKQNKKVSWLRKWKMLQPIAASLIFSVLVLSAFLLLQNNPERMVCAVKVRTNPGVISTFDLPDGSKVWLNSGSTLEYPSEFSSDNRPVKLTGEGYFEVANNPAKPFIININESYSIEVLGTTLNVSAYADDPTIETILVEGSVTLHMLSSSGKSIEQKLNPKEKAEYKKSSKSVEIIQVNPDVDTAWKNGEIRFRKSPMEKVLKVLSRHFHVEFEVTNSTIYESIINLTVKDETITQVMDYLKMSSDIDYEIIKPKNTNEIIDKTIIVISK